MPVRRYRLLAFFGMTTVFGGSAIAQTPGSQFTCSATVTVPPVLRAEGFTEQIGDIVLTCTGGSPTPQGQPLPLLNLTATFNASVSNPTVVANSGFTDALLLIDEPAPANQVVAPVTAYSGLSYQGPTLLSDGAGGTIGASPNVFYGRVANENTIEWLGEPLLQINTTGSSTFRITNVRVNASKANTSTQNMPLERVTFGFEYYYPLSKSPQAEEKKTIPLLSAASSAVPISISPSTLTVANIVPDFEYQANAGSAPANQALNSGLLSANPVLPASPSATLNISELFPDLIKVRSTGYQDVPGQVYNTDAGFTSPAIPPVLANFGTEFQAVFNNIPAGVSVFVGTTVTGVNPLMGGAALGVIQLTSPGAAAGSTGLTQLPVTKGSATAIWETQSADPTRTGTFTVPVYFAFQSGVPAPANITVVQSLGSPPGGVAFAQPSPLIPLLPLFTINTGASGSATLSATMDPRPCIVGIVFYTGNACSPSNGLLVNTFSDTKSIPLNQPTFPMAGNLSEFALGGGSTPIHFSLFVKPGSANPGVYNQTIDVSAQGAANSLSLPFTVTVLPPNNPIFELNGITDAFSYQSETITPGQIYTLFGSNFGPPSGLVSGTLDSSGKLSTNVANTQVLFDGVASPLLYVANGQLSGWLRSSLPARPRPMFR